MIRHTLIITVIDALYRLTVDADRMAWMSQGAAERIPPLSLLRKAFTAGSVTVAGVLATHHDVSLAAQTVLIMVQFSTTHFKSAMFPSPSAAFCGVSSSFLILKF